MTPRNQAENNPAAQNQRKGGTKAKKELIWTSPINRKKAQREGVTPKAPQNQQEEGAAQKGHPEGTAEAPQGTASQTPSGAVKGGAGTCTQ